MLGPIEPRWIKASALGSRLAVRRLCLASCALLLLITTAHAAEPRPLRLSVFQADVTPPLGSPLCDGLVPVADSVHDPLYARGVVLHVQPPIVLCALDWVGIGNTGHVLWREELAKAAGTSPERVAIHCLHQHDAPGFDLLAEEIAASAGLAGKLYNVAFTRQALARTATAVQESLAQARPITHFGVGQGLVEQVASNRRPLGPDGKVIAVRYSATRDPAVRALPEGTIDPHVRLVAFWSGEQPVASLTYYATHPQSYYGQGDISADFPGLARATRDQDHPGPMHIHFNGAGGNITAGKYNDGSPENRPVLAARLAAGMKQAWEDAASHRQPIAAADVRWRFEPLTLPVRYTDLAPWKAQLEDTQRSERERLIAARQLAFHQYMEAGGKAPLSCLLLGEAAIVHMPGELFVEYQLVAQKLRSGSFVAMAAYGDYGAGYIGTEISYTQGGYETTPVSRVAPQVEGVLNAALTRLLEK